MKLNRMLISRLVAYSQTRLPKVQAPQKRMTVAGVDQIVNRELLQKTDTIATESAEISQLKDHKRHEYLMSKANELSLQLVEQSVISTLGSTSPLTLNYLLESRAIRQLSPVQLIYLLNYMMKTKFAKTIEPTEAFKYLEEVINTRMEQLGPSQVNGIVNVLSKSKSDREDLYSRLSIVIMENVDAYDIRTISNVMNNYTNISRKVKGFRKFYAFMKEIIAKRLYMASYTGKDLAHILTAYSKTYNMSPSFLKLLEDRALHVIDRSNINFKEITIYTHTFYLNRSAHVARDMFEFSRFILNEHTKYLNMTEFLTILKAIEGLGQYDKQHFEALVKNIRKYYESMNLLDVRDSYGLFWKYLQTNKDAYFDSEGLGKEPAIYRVKPKLAETVNMLMRAFNKLHRNVDIADVDYYMEHINYAIDHNTEESREFVKNLRSTLKLSAKYNKLSQAERTKLIQKAKQIKVDKIQKLFINSLSK